MPAVGPLACPRGIELCEKGFNLLQHQHWTLCSDLLTTVLGTLIYLSQWSCRERYVYSFFVGFKVNLMFIYAVIIFIYPTLYVTVQPLYASKSTKVRNHLRFLRPLTSQPLTWCGLRALCTSNQGSDRQDKNREKAGQTPEQTPKQTVDKDTSKTTQEDAVPRPKTGTC